MSAAIFVALGAANVPGFRAFAGRTDDTFGGYSRSSWGKRDGEITLGFVPRDGEISNYADCKAYAPNGTHWHSHKGHWLKVR